jgi:hypothetical protein
VVGEVLSESMTTLVAVRRSYGASGTRREQPSHSNTRAVEVVGVNSRPYVLRVIAREARVIVS